MSKEEREHLDTFILRLGFVTGSLRNPYVVEYLKERGASEADIGELYRRLLKVFHPAIERGKRT